MESITSLLSIALGAILVNNFIFSQFLGICPFMGVSKKVETALGMGIAVTFVMGVASAVNWPINEFLNNNGLGFMQTVTFIVVIASLVQFVEMFLKKMVPPLYAALGIFLPLITTNCAVMGVVFAERAEFLQLRREPDLRYHRRSGFPAGHRPVRQRAGTYGVQQVAQGVRWVPHCPGGRQLDLSGLHGLLWPESLVREAKREL